MEPRDRETVGKIMEPRDRETVRKIISLEIGRK